MKKQIYKNFDWQVPAVVSTLIKGKDAEKLYNAIKEDEKLFGEDSELGFLDYNSSEIRGSNPLRTGQIYNLIKDSGIRVSVLRDNINGDIFNLIKGRYYSDFNALVVHKNKPSYEKNNGLWKKVIELAEKTNGNVKYPFMVQGFYVLPDKTEKDYGIKIVPAPNFEIIESDKFSEKYNGWKFDNLDNEGVPFDLNKSNGDFTLLTRNDGLSGVFLDGDGGLYAGGDGLAGSGDCGRVGFVNDAAGVAPKSFDVEKAINEKISKLENLKQEYLTKVKNI